MSISAELDEDIVDAMDDVDWHDVSHVEAQSVGTSIGSYQDAVTESTVAEASYRRVTRACFIIACVVSLAVLLKASTTATVVATWVMTLVASTFYRLQHTIAVNLVQTQKESLLDELDELKLRQEDGDQRPRKRG